ncbi:MAG: ATP synthase F0 subunit B [Myxococcota bacterium]
MEVNATLLMQLAVLVLLLAWLSHFLLNPLLELFSERERRTNGVAAAASQLNAQAGENSGEIEQILASARRESERIQLEFKAQAQQHREQVLTQAKQQARQHMQQARQDLAGETTRLKKQLRQQQNGLARELFDRLVTPSTSRQHRQALPGEK